MLRKTLAFALHSHLLLAISSFLFSLGVLGFSNDSIFFSMALSSSVLGVYNVHRLIKLQRNELQPGYRIWYGHFRKPLIFLSLVSFLIASVSYFLVLKPTFIFVFLFGLSVALTLFYLIPFKGKKWRDLTNAKAFLISFVWLLIAVILPELSMHTLSYWDFSYFLLFFALTIPGDLRDKDFDQKQLRTIPQRFGKKGSYVILLLTFSLFFIFQYFILSGNLVLLLTMVVFLFLLFRFFEKSTFEFKFELMDSSLFIVGLVHFIFINI